MLALAWLSLGLGGLLVALWSDDVSGAFALFAVGVQDSGASGTALVLALSVFVAASGVLPASLVGIGAGALYGFQGGVAIGVFATLAGAMASFWISRSWLRPVVESHIDRRHGWRSLDRQIAKDGWRFVCLLRISPLMPFAATSFSLGLSSVRTSAYLLGTLAALPALVGFVSLGTIAGGIGVSGLAEFGMLRVAILALGGLATIALSAKIGRYVLQARRDIRDADAESNEP
jgi:uncharacterized membrane protein YdjX (TVP38/TMEM64 family)